MNYYFNYQVEKDDYGEQNDITIFNEALTEFNECSIENHADIAKIIYEEICDTCCTLWNTKLIIRIWTKEKEFIGKFSIIGRKAIHVLKKDKKIYKYNICVNDAIEEGLKDNIKLFEGKIKDYKFNGNNLRLVAEEVAVEFFKKHCNYVDETLAVRIWDDKNKLIGIYHVDAEITMETYVTEVTDIYEYSLKQKKEKE